VRDSDDAETFFGHADGDSDDVAQTDIAAHGNVRPPMDALLLRRRRLRRGVAALVGVLAALSVVAVFDWSRHALKEAPSAGIRARSLPKTPATRVALPSLAKAVDKTVLPSAANQNGRTTILDD
jgi:hypothetical protein